MKRIAGAKQVQKAIENGRAVTVFIALDADEAISKKFIELSKKNAVNVVFKETMALLGKESGIAVGSAVAAEICD